LRVFNRICNHGFASWSAGVTPGEILHSAFLFRIPQFLSSKHRHQKGRHSDFVKFSKGEGDNMKFLSVLFTCALLVTANGLAAHLRHIRALPVRSTAASNLHHIENNQ